MQKVNRYFMLFYSSIECKMLIVILCCFIVALNIGYLNKIFSRHTNKYFHNIPLSHFYKSYQRKPTLKKCFHSF